MKRSLIALGSILLAIWAPAFRAAGHPSPAGLPASPAPVAHWSLEAQRAIVPPPAGVGDKFPGEAAVYMGIVHAAMYDVAVAIHRGYRPYAISLTAPAEMTPAAAIAAAAHDVLVGLLPMQSADLDNRYAKYLSTLPNNVETSNGKALGQKVAVAILARRANDGGTVEIPQIERRSAPGLFEPDPARPAVGFRLSTMRPLALESANQFRPSAPHRLDSPEYATDFEEVSRFGGAHSDVRTEQQTDSAVFWMDHDVRQWNDGLLRLAAERNLDLMQAARMLALAHVSGGDAMIACFNAKYHYMFWRPAAAVALSSADGRPRTQTDATWRPLRTTPNHPEYPAAHACHTSAVVEALSAFFGTADVRVSLDSRTTGTTRSFAGLEEIVRAVEDARVFAGFHFRSANVAGSTLGRDVARFVAARHFRP